MDISGTPSSSSRRRSRENETPSQRHKREKAAERQRRKRERDRQAGLNNILMVQAQHQQGVIPPPEAPVSAPPIMAEYSSMSSSKPPADDLSPDEVVRRERVRAAARDRQRKHRALVKQKKLRELGLDMGNDIIQSMEDVQYRINDSQYQQVMAAHELQPPPPHPAHPHGGHTPMHEPPFPTNQPLGGQTFASTLLLSFSCAPLLKQHLLRTLSMTNEELASLEPIIAQAWDHWDQQRRMHYAHHPANAPKPSDGSAEAAAAASYAALADHAASHTYIHESSSHIPPNDFRARFARPLVAPSPFRASIEAAQTNGAVVSSASTNGGQPESLDPHLTTKAPPAPPPLTLDPQLGQARDEAATVAGKLDRT